jgi:hypothetical protein
MKVGKLYISFLFLYCTVGYILNLMKLVISELGDDEVINYTVHSVHVTKNQ